MQHNKKEPSDPTAYSARLKSSRTTIEAVCNYLKNPGEGFRNAPVDNLFNEIEREFSNIILLRTITALYRAGFRSEKELFEQIPDSAIADPVALAEIARRAQWLIDARSIIGQMKQLRLLTVEEMQEGFIRVKGFLNNVKSKIDAQRFASDYIFQMKGNRVISDSRIEDAVSYLDSGLLYSEGVQLVRVPWRILPPGEHPFPAVLEHFESLAKRNKNLKLEKERLQEIFNLEPTLAIIGEQGFEGYAIFLFKDSDKAALECPYYGNATYIIKSDRISLSKLTKKELIIDNPRKYHSDNWLSWLKKSLGKTITTEGRQDSDSESGELENE